LQIMADEEEETPQERLRQKHKKEEKELRGFMKRMYIVSYNLTILY